MAPLRCAAKFDPFLSLNCARVEGKGHNPRRDQILPSVNLAQDVGGIHGTRDEELSVPVAAGADRQRSRSFDPAAVDPSVLGSEAAAAALKIMVSCLSPSNILFRYPIA